MPEEIPPALGSRIDLDNVSQRLGQLEADCHLEYVQSAMSDDVTLVTIQGSTIPTPARHVIEHDKTSIMQLDPETSVRIKLAYEHNL